MQLIQVGGADRNDIQSLYFSVRRMEPFAVQQTFIKRVLIVQNCNCFMIFVTPVNVNGNLGVLKGAQTSQNDITISPPSSLSHVKDS